MSLENAQNEKWKKTRLSEYYEISDQGRVKSLRAKKPIILKLRLNKNGYFRVCLYLKRKKYHCSVHRLMAEAFIPNPENKRCINHINGVRNDNRLDNIEWCTHAENLAHARKNGRFKYGSGSNTAKLTKQDRIDIMDLFKNKKIPSRAIGKIYGVSGTTILNVVHGTFYQDSRQN